MYFHDPQASQQICRPLPSVPGKHLCFTNAAPEQPAGTENHHDTTRNSEGAAPAGNLGAQVRCDVNAQVVACSSRDDSDGSACAISWSSQRLLDAHGVAEGNVEGVPAVCLEQRKV